MRRSEIHRTEPQEAFLKSYSSQESSDTGKVRGKVHTTSTPMLAGLVLTKKGKLISNSFPFVFTDVYVPVIKTSIQYQDSFGLTKFFAELTLAPLGCPKGPPMWFFANSS